VGVGERQATRQAYQPDGLVIAGSRYTLPYLLPYRVLPTADDCTVAHSTLQRQGERPHAIIANL